jgi:hypothetical protein
MAPFHPSSTSHGPHPQANRDSGIGRPTTYQPSHTGPVARRMDGSGNCTHLIRVCPDCAGPVVRSSGCINCTQCGWGQCG